MKKIFLALVITVLVSNLSWAIENTLKNRTKEADRYFAVTPPNEMMQDMAQQMSMNLPVEQREGFKDLLIKYVDIVALEATIKNAMINHFTADELKGLADFYGSSVGKSTMKKFGAYMVIDKWKSQDAPM